MLTDSSSRTPLYLILRFLIVWTRSSADSSNKEAMLQDVIHPPEQLPIEGGLSSPTADHLFDLCDPALLSGMQQNSELSSCSDCCYDTTSYTNDLSFSSFTSDHSPNFSDFITTTAPPPSPNTLSILLDSHPADPDVDPHLNLADLLSSPSQSASPFALPSTFQLPTQNDQFDLASLQLPLTDVINANGFSPCSPDCVVQLGAGLPFGAVFEEDCLSSLPPSYVGIDSASPSSSSFLDHHGLGGFMMGTLSGGMCGEGSGISSWSMNADSGLNSHEMEFQGENSGVFCSDSVYCSGDMQSVTDNQQQMVKSCGSPIGLTSDISTLEESNYKVGRLSVEARKEKIHRYMKKRNERNFSKKIKYACRKTLADSRPRVRGRFAKNDELGEASRRTRSNHEDEDEEETMVVVKEEEEMPDSSDIFAHITGVNSFNYQYPIQSWI